MPIVLAVILGVVQASTEFLPVSSSGHLVVFQILLVPHFGNVEIPLAFDVLVHLATLLIVIIYLKNDIINILRPLLARSAIGQKSRKLAMLVVVGSIPAGLVGILAKDYIEAAFSTAHVAGYGFALTTIWLLAGHHAQAKSGITTPSLPTSHEEELFSWRLPTFWQALLIGTAQAIAIIPGVSRSGSTIASGLLVKLPAESALRFSFLLSIPAILGAAVLQSSAMMAIPISEIPAYTVAFLVTAMVGWGAIRWLVVFTKQSKLGYFAAYTGVMAIIATQI